MLGSAKKYLGHLGKDRPDRWEPMLAVVYLTYRCSFRCPYCSDGAGQPYYRLRASDLGAAAMLELLARVRRHCEHVVLTGGEPLEHPEIAAILAGMRALAFETVVFTTNGRDLGPLLPELRGNVTDLVLSLDTLDHEKADAWYGRGAGTHAAIMAVHEMVRRRAGRGYRVHISTVITPDNLDDVDAVYDYAKARGFRLAACPQLVGVKAHSALGSDPRYVGFFDRLIAEKRKGADIHGTIGYLEAMRDLAPFACRPFTMLTVSPEGNVFYPCLEIGHVAGNLLANDDLSAIRREGHRMFGPQPTCGTQCHSACALGFACLLKQPTSIIHEGYLGLVRAGRGLVTRQR
jgi:MoaA/NifB/PqqE/SkfB family radical SAM enzyme